MRRHHVLTLAPLLALAGCASAPQRVALPAVVQVPGTRYVPIPAALTVPCPIAEPKALTVGEAVGIARERKRALQVCNAQLDQIRALQGTESKGH